MVDKMIVSNLQLKLIVCVCVCERERERERNHKVHCLIRANNVWIFSSSSTTVTASVV